MRMPARLARAIQRGAKTTVRVPVDTRLTARPLRPARRHGGRPFHPHEGDLLTIYGGQHEQADGREKWVTTDVVHVTANTVTRCELGTLTVDQAKAEGHDSVEEFEIAFIERHERAWLNRQVSYLLEQGISADDALDTRDAWARVRYQHLWAPRDVWLLEVRAMHDLPVFLAPAGRPKGSELGYVHSAAGAIDDIERIPVERLNEKWRTTAVTRHREAIDTEEHRRQARLLSRQVRQLAMDGHPLAEQIRDLLNDLTEKAA